MMRTRTLENREKLYSLITIYYQINKETAIKICKYLIDNPEEAPNQSEVSYINYTIGLFYYENAQYEKSFYHCNMAEKAFVLLKNQPYVAKMLYTKASILNYKKDFVGAEKLAIKALEIAKKINDEGLTLNCYLTIGSSLAGMLNYNEALVYYQKSLTLSIALSKKQSNSASVAQSLNYIAKTYQKKGEYRKSITFAQQGLDIKNIKQDEPEIYCYLVNNLAYSLFKSGDFAAENLFRKSLKTAESLNNIPVQITSKTYLAELLIAKKETEQAVRLLSSAQAQAHNNGIIEDEIEILKLSITASPDNQIRLSNRLLKLTDSLQTVERNTRDKFARIAYETKEISNQNKIVEVKNKQLQTNFWLLGTVAILAVFSVYLLNNNRLQKLKTKQLALEQKQKIADATIFALMLEQQQKIDQSKQKEQNRIALELHDNIVSQLEVIRLQFDLELYKGNLNHSEVYDKLLHNLKNVVLEIRDVSHDLSNNVFSSNVSFIKIVQELISQTKEYADLKFKLDVSPTVDWTDISSDLKINLFRVIQEGIQNIYKHAQATEVTIGLRTENHVFELSIADNGKGFAKNQAKGIGIQNMKARATAMNGKLLLESQENIGTTVSLQIPI